MKIAVIGSGGWGLASAKLLHGNGHDVTVWCFLQEEADLLLSQHGNEKLLPGIKLSEDIGITTDIACVADAETIVVAVPSFGVASTARSMLPYMKEGQTVVLLSKGFDKEHGYCLLSDTLECELQGRAPVVALTGPSHAEEVARGVITAVVAASRDPEAALRVQNTFMNAYFRVYTSHDIVSAELGGAMKNIMALAVGISDGAGFGDNTKAMIMTRGITEMSRLGEFLGGRRETFSGLSGVGDLIVTCISQHSRNRRAGLLIGGGTTPEEALKQVGAVVEGYYATQAVHELVRGKDIDMPICDAMYQLLFEGAPLECIVNMLITRNKKPEDDR